ncbi:uncharacterized protein ACRADG_010707 isoform 2-T2 [Cochliomyia hominivorax]
MWALNKINLSSSVWLIMSFTVLLPLTDGQAYHFIIGHHQSNFGQLYRESNSRTYVADTNYTSDTSTADLENNNSTIIVTTVRESNELSQTAMDIITIVWYVATFLALAAFFLLMACSDRRCSDTQHNANMNTSDTPIPPPTPSPSYSEFAPPSYESVMKMQIASKTNVYVVPFSSEQVSVKDGISVNPNSNNTSPTGAQPLTPNINFYTINELHKLGS